MIIEINVNRFARAGVKLIDASPEAVHDAYNTSYSYSPAGSITSLKRRGLIEIGQNGPEYGLIDDLIYFYQNEHLIKVSDEQLFAIDPIAQPKGFVPVVSDYDYDGNGNLIEDSGKDLNIDYNLLNLPSLVSHTNGDNMSFEYTFGGEKIKKESTVDGNTEERFYIGGFEFVNGVAEFFSHSEGRIVLSGGNKKYQYKISDHLGNTVVLFEDKDGDGLISTIAFPDPEDNEVIQRNLYYPFGLSMDGIWNDMTSPRMDYLYNGKELNEELGLNWLSFGFREYDPAIGRFPSVDPLAEKFAHVSGFNYAENEPVGHIDLWGLQKYDFMGVHDPNGVQQSYQAGGKEQIKEDKAAFDEGFVRGMAYSMAAGGILFFAIEAGAVGTGAFILEEGAEAIIEEISGVPIIIDPVDIVEQGVKKGVKNHVEKKATKSTNKLKADTKATGDHTSFMRDDNEDVFKYEEFITNPKNPNGFDAGNRFDGGKPDGSPGAPHTNKKTKEPISTPHVQGKNIPGGVRKPKAEEIPNNKRFNN